MLDFHKNLYYWSAKTKDWQYQGQVAGRDEGYCHLFTVHGRSVWVDDDGFTLLEGNRRQIFSNNDPMEILRQKRKEWFTRKKAGTETKLQPDIFGLSVETDLQTFQDEVARITSDLERIFKKHLAALDEAVHQPLSA